MFQGQDFSFTSCLLLQLSLTGWKVSFLTPSFLQWHLNFSLCSCSRCCTAERKVKHLMALLMVKNCLFLKFFLKELFHPSSFCCLFESGWWGQTSLSLAAFLIFFAGTFPFPARSAPGLSSGRTCLKHLT